MVISLLTKNKMLYKSFIKLLLTVKFQLMFIHLCKCYQILNNSFIKMICICINMFKTFDFCSDKTRQLKMSLLRGVIVHFVLAFR